jgi:hypothetical protein
MTTPGYWCHPEQHPEVQELNIMISFSLLKESEINRITRKPHKTIDPMINFRGRYSNFRSGSFFLCASITPATTI